MALLIFFIVFVPNVSSQLMIPNPIGEPGFETVTGWIYTEYDTYGSLSGAQSTTWKTEGTYSYKLGETLGHVGVGDYAQISRNVNFTGAIILHFDGYSSVVSHLQVRIDSLDYYNSGWGIISSQNISVAGVTGVHTLKFIYNPECGTECYGSARYFYLDNLKMYNNSVPTVPITTQHLNYFNNSSTTIAWGASSDLDSDTLYYYVKVGTSSGASDILLYNDTDTTSNSFSITGPNSYYYSVQACDPYECSAWSSEKVFRHAVIEPYTPLNGSIQYFTYPPMTASVYFTWSEIGGGLSYNLKVATDIDFQQIAVDTTTSNNYSTQELIDSKYYWKVQYYNSSSGQFYNWSDISNFTVHKNYSAAGTGVQGVVYKLVEGQIVPISGATVYIYDNLTTYSNMATTGSNGYYLFTGLKNGTYALRATKADEYDDSATYYTTIYGNISTQNILMQTCTIAYNCFAGKVDLKFTVRNFWGTRYYQGVTTTVYKGSDVLPLETKNTGSNGVVSFNLIKNGEYRITFVNLSQGINVEYTIIAFEGTYDIVVSTDTDGWFTGGHNEAADIRVITATTIINSTHALITATYNDSMGQTSGLSFFLNQSNPHDFLNQTHLQTVLAGSSGNYTTQFTVSGYKGQGYIIHVTSSHTTYGTIDKTYGVSFEGIPASIPLSVALLTTFAVIVIFYLASMFGSTSATQGSLIICGLGWIFLAMGFLGTIGLNTAGALTLATLFAIFNNYNERQKQENIT